MRNGQEGGVLWLEAVFPLKTGVSGLSVWRGRWFDRVGGNFSLRQ